MPGSQFNFVLNFLNGCEGKTAEEITPKLFREYMYKNKGKKLKYGKMNKSFILSHAESHAADFKSNIEKTYNSIKKYCLLKELEGKGYSLSKYFTDSSDLDEIAKRGRIFSESTIESILNDFYSSFDELSERYIDPEESKTKGSLTISYAGLLDTTGESEEPLIEGYLLDKTFNNIVGAPKVGKSFLGYQIAFCVQNGVPFMGLTTRRANVLYIDFELRNRAINERFDWAKEFYKLPDAERFKMINLAKTWGSDDTTLQDIVDLAADTAREDTNLGLIVFDCYYRFAEGEENKAEDTKLTLNMLKTLTQYATVIYIHHANKGGVKQGAGAINSGSGSNVHGRIVDQSLVIDADGFGMVTVNNTGRDFSREIQCKRDDRYGYFRSRSGLESMVPDIHVDEALAKEVLEYVKESLSENNKGPDERTLLNHFKSKGLTKEMFRSLPYMVDRNHRITPCFVISATE